MRFLQLSNSQIDSYDINSFEKDKRSFTILKDKKSNPNITNCLNQPKNSSGISSSILNTKQAENFDLQIVADKSIRKTSRLMTQLKEKNDMM